MLLAISVLGGAQVCAQEVVGRWQGMWAGTPKLRSVLEITKTSDGRLSAELYSIDEVPDAFPTDSVTMDGTTLRLAFTKKVQAIYIGQVASDGRSIL
jgi:hypothetical protein